jgi:hypothetical protein
MIHNNDHNLIMIREEEANLEDEITSEDVG